jgi:hypothetical protein
MKKLMLAMIILVASCMALKAQNRPETYEPEPAGYYINTETDIATDLGVMTLQPNGKYRVTLEGVSMRKAVDLMVDNCIKAKVDVQTFDLFVITYDTKSKVYTITDSNDQSYFESTSVEDIRKELKRVVKLALDNL